ncbi:hypothetical protein CDAR_412831 [Caerostris darwini]|uniref:Uncharacterized protein n=1 Tax=Caerostris darwini TaxID=1538125 RepID=A0AAV4SFR1_9ARAC|nr:hypothetical protein CDAR_412831 [Caerostris darwini]
MWAIRTSRYRPGLKWLTGGLKVPGDGDGGFSGSKQKANRVWNFDLLLIGDRISLSAHIFGEKTERRLRRFFTVEKGEVLMGRMWSSANSFGIFMSF